MNKDQVMINLNQVAEGKPEIKELSIPQLKKLFADLIEGLTGNFIGIIPQAIPRYTMLGDKQVALGDQQRQGLAMKGAKAGALVIGMGATAKTNEPKAAIGRLAYLDEQNPMPALGITRDGYTMHAIGVHQVVIFVKGKWDSTLLKM